MHERDACASGLGRQVERPIPEGFRPFLHRLHRGGYAGPPSFHAPSLGALERIDVLVHEALDAVAKLADLVGNAEVHGALQKICR